MTQTATTPTVQLDLREAAKQAHIEHATKEAKRVEEQERYQDEAARLHVISEFKDWIGDGFQHDQGVKVQLGGADRWVLSVEGVQFIADHCAHRRALFIVEQCPRCHEWCVASGPLNQLRDIGAHLLGEARYLQTVYGSKHLCPDERQAAEEAEHEREERKQSEEVHRPPVCTATERKLLDVLKEFTGRIANAEATEVLENRNS